MKKFGYYFFFVVFIISSSLPLIANAEIFRSVDEDGHVTYSDSPQQGAERVILPELQHYTGENGQTQAPASTYDSPYGEMQQQTETKHVEYNDLAIVSPANEATIRDNLGRVSIAIELSPSLQDNDKMVLMVDGKVAHRFGANGGPKPNLPPGVSAGDAHTVARFSMVLSNVDRGTHDLQAQVLSDSGETLITSNKVVVYVHRAIKGQANQSQGVGAFRSPGALPGGSVK